jgi:small subunit ribosomal protein S6
VSTVTRRYEVVYVFDSALEEPAVGEKLARFHALLGENVQVAVNHWGKRTLAYRLGRHEAGYYVVARFEVEPAVLPEYERAITLDEGVLRFLVVVAEAEMPVAAPAEAEAPAAVASEEDDE